MNTMMKPTPYKISTITATGSIHCDVDLAALFDSIHIPDEQQDDDCHAIVYMEYGLKRAETTSVKGKRRKHVSSRRKKEGVRRFDNQATMVIRMNSPHHDTSYVNMKVFRNGNIQMTGLKHIEQGADAIDFLMDTIRRHGAAAAKIVESVDAMHNTGYSVRLINCDFRVGFEIKRDKLHKLMQQKYSVYCSYEPCIYPGVKIQYCWNAQSVPPEPLYLQGVCQCTRPCSGKGCGSGDGECKKITIAVFQSGCIIITGAQSHEQINTAYTFICNILRTHMDCITKTVAAPIA